MKTSRLSPPIVAAIGIVLSLLAVSGIFFFLIKPVQDQTTAAQARLDAASPDATDAANIQAKKALKDAIIQVALIKGQWAQREAQLMPPYDVGGTKPEDRFHTLRQLTYELDHYLGPDLERQMRTTGITSTTKFSLPAPPFNPNDITNAPIVIPLGSITVNGEFRAILTHFYDWQYFNRLVLVDNLALHGNSPYMQGTYNATVYIFPQNDDKLPAPIAAAGGAAATPAGGGSSAFGGRGGSGGPVAADHPAAADKRRDSDKMKAFRAACLLRGITHEERGQCLHGMAER